MENHLRKKLDWHLMPPLLILYLLAYLDRINISFAQLQMQVDLGFSDAIYGLGAGLFFIGYILVEVPSNVLLKKFGPRRWLARIIFSWGLISAAMMFVHTPLQFYGMRFLLGLAEAGFFPGIIYYISLWYPPEHCGRANSIFMSAIAWAGVVGGPLSASIMQFMDNWHGLQGWQWLFIAEGLPAILAGILVWWYLPDSPLQVRWLSDYERQFIIEHCQCNSATSDNRKLWYKAIWQPSILLLGIIYFMFICGLYGLSFWLPQILREDGSSSLLATGWLTAIPWLIASLIMIWWGKHSDAKNERRHHMQLAALMAAIAMLGAVYTTNLGLSVFFLSLSASGVLACLSINWTLPQRYLGTETIAAGIAMINTIGNFGGYVSPVLTGWLRDNTGSIHASLYLSALAMLLSVILLSLPILKSKKGLC